MERKSRRARNGAFKLFAKLPQALVVVSRIDWNVAPRELTRLKTAHAF